MKKQKAKLEANPYAPIIIRQIADSMIVMAAALLIVGVNLEDYFKPDSSNQKAAIIIERQVKLIEQLDNRLKQVDNRLIEVERLKHKPANIN